MSEIWRGRMIATIAATFLLTAAATSLVTWRLKPGEKTLESLTKLQPAKESSHVLPWFLPGGKFLLFTVKPHQWGTRSHVEVLSLETGRRTVLIPDSADARFVPTGHIVYMSEGVLMAVPFDADYDEEYPAISPDGHWLAYCSDETGQHEVYVTAASTNPAKGTLVTSGGGLAPLWSPDNRTLYYWNLDWTKLMAMEIRKEGSISVGRSRQLFAFPAEFISYVRSYDISHDGSKFLIVGRAERKPIEVTRLILVQNWLEELKRLCPASK